MSEVHVWYLFPHACPPALEEQAFGLMSSDERARHDGFVFPEGKREYLLTRALVRTTLSRYGALAPADWRFTAGPHGRPALDPDVGLHFNLSNAPGLIACIVGAQPELGIDVERIVPVAIADQNFSPSELAALRALPEADQAARYFELWTLKEAYLKARGLGVGVRLDRLSFDVSGAQARAAFEGAQSWQFERLAASAEHKVSIAVRSATRIRVVEQIL